MVIPWYYHGIFIMVKTIEIRSQLFWFFSENYYIWPIKNIIEGYFYILFYFFCLFFKGSSFTFSCDFNHFNFQATFHLIQRNFHGRSPRLIRSWKSFPWLSIFFNVDLQAHNIFKVDSTQRSWYKCCYVTGAHTQGIERCWKSWKAYVRKMRCVREDSISTYLYHWLFEFNRTQTGVPRNQIIDDILEFFV